LVLFLLAHVIIMKLGFLNVTTTVKMGDNRKRKKRIDLKGP
jgi:hypothetical protein